MRKDEFAVDWISATLPVDLWGDGLQGAQKAVRRLGFEGALGVVRPRRNAGTGQVRGLLGWQNSATFANDQGLLAWGGQSGTLYISLSAQALANIQMIWDVGPTEVLGRLIEAGFKVRRLDWAWDNYGGVFDKARLREHLRNMSATATRFRGAQIIDNLNDGEGWTINVGSRRSDNFIRIYDKRAEQEQEAEGGTWERLELEVKGQRAHRVALLWRATGFEVAWAKEYLAGLIRFTEIGDDDINSTRRKTAGWWLAWLGTQARVRVTLETGARTVADVLDWLERQASTSLELVAAYWSEERLIAEVKRMQAIGRRRWSSKQKAIFRQSLLEGV